MSKFFINRPIVAMVIAVLTVIVANRRDCGPADGAQFPNGIRLGYGFRGPHGGEDAQALEQSVAINSHQTSRSMA